MDEERIRAFIAVELPDEIRKRISKFEKRLSSDVRIVQENQLHVTMFFFESIDRHSVDELKIIIDSIGASSFRVNLQGIGVFTPQRPRVVFVKVDDGSEVLSEIYDFLKVSIETLHLPLEEEKRAFTPHVTIGRVKRTDGKIPKTINELVASNSGEQFGSFMCNEVVLIKSTLTEKGPVYEKLYAKRLG